MVELASRSDHRRGCPPASGRKVSPCASVTVTTDSHSDESIIIPGLIYGALLGPGLRITRCEPGLLAASRQLAWGSSPDYLEVVDGGDRPDELRIDLWCGSLRRRCGLRAMALGAVLATALALLAGWLLVISVPCAALTALVYDQIAWRTAQRDLERRIRTYFSNLRYMEKH